MRFFVISLPGNFIDCFRGRRLVWHMVAIVLTVIMVLAGLDWRYFLATRSPELRRWMFPAVHIGGLLPLVLPLLLLFLGGIFRQLKTVQTGWAVAQAEILGSLISSCYKALTGRAHPMHSPGADLTHIFRFGFLRGGVFWGWPSSHTTIAFAMAACICALFPRQKWLGVCALLYALYVGVGVSMTIHWLSDFVAGAIIGSVIGFVVGRSFKAREAAPPKLQG